MSHTKDILHRSDMHTMENKIAVLEQRNAELDALSSAISRDCNAVALERNDYREKLHLANTRIAELVEALERLVDSPDYVGIELAKEALAAQECTHEPPCGMCPICKGTLTAQEVSV
jgi:chromosome segregation ATPase